MNWGMREKEGEGAVLPYKGRERSGPKPLNRGGSGHGPRRFTPRAATWCSDTRETARSHREGHTDPEKWLGSAVEQLIRARKPKGSDP
jgi:hypothetical protein